ncbi:expressed conserved protein [Echinococcus multilocularis]|uniref:Expressed conserved protein n=1 Tax=Echinococcus multilocularis TaxID=6211 RepID=A0A068Y1R2_ECHMU|nr:expressed conserved protein [Echinococcus multilocularis]
MQLFWFNGTLILVTLLPVSILAYGSTVESIIDSTLEDAPEYLTANAEKFHVNSVKSLVRSCPFSFYETLLNGEVTYTIDICINATRLIILPPNSIAKKVDIGKTKLDISIQVRKAPHPNVTLELSAPVFDDAYVYIGSWPIGAGLFKNLIISQAKTMLEGELRSFISALG